MGIPGFAPVVLFLRPDGINLIHNVLAFRSHLP